MGRDKLGRQHVTEGAIVYIEGYEFVARNVQVEECDGVDRVIFDGVCTDSPRNDSIRGRIYDGGQYGGNHLVYTWDPSTPRVGQQDAAKRCVTCGSPSTHDEAAGWNDGPVVHPKCDACGHAEGCPSRHDVSAECGC